VDAKIYEIYFKAKQLRSSDSESRDGDRRVSSVIVDSDGDREEKKKVIEKILEKEYGIKF